jgi:hypothetical protein
MSTARHQNAHNDFVATITNEDIAFVSVARKQYRYFAEAAERQGHADTAAKMRAQEFHAERLLTRFVEGVEATEGVRLPELRARLLNFGPTVEQGGSDER